MHRVKCLQMIDIHIPYPRKNSCSGGPFLEAVDARKVTILAHVWVCYSRYEDSSMTGVRGGVAGSKV